MATYTSTEGIGGFLPPDYGPLVIEPVQAEAVTFQTGTTVTTGATQFHVPVIRDDFGAAWVAEGDEITEDPGTFDELVTVPVKVAGLAIVSRELADDSSPAAAQEVGRSIARSVADQVDRAFFGDLPAPAPPGLESLTSPSPVEAGAAWGDLDPFAEALSAAEQVGATVDTFVANPADALTLATLKVADGSNQPLLGVDATNGTERRILGVPLLVSRHVTPGTVWGVPRDRVLVVMRDNVRVETSEHVAFRSDSVAVRATMRIGFAFPSEQSIIKVMLQEGS